MEGVDAVASHQIIPKLAEGDKLISHDAKRLKELEKEKQRLKKIVADQALDIDLLRELTEGNC